MVLHNTDLGPALAEKAFPSRADIREIALRHVREDMDCEPTLHDWLSACDIRRLPAPSAQRRGFAREDLVDALTSNQRLASADGLAAVADILLLPRDLAPEFGDAALAVLCNSAGPFIVRQILGPPYQVPATGSHFTIFDPAWAAEAMIVWMMGRRIPQLSEVVGTLRRIPHALGKTA